MALTNTERSLHMNREDRLTLFDLVAAVQDSADNESEMMATLRHMLETGHVQFEAVGTETLPWSA